MEKGEVMAKYDKNSIYKVSEQESGIEEGLFIGISNKHYQEMWKYWCFLDFYDKYNEEFNRKEMTQEDIEKELGYKIKIVN